MKLPTYQDLSKEQDAINNLPLEGTYLVTGPPGTGKTVMALYRAQMISERGERVKLLNAWEASLAIHPRGRRGARDRRRGDDVPQLDAWLVAGKLEEATASLRLTCTIGPQSSPWRLRNRQLRGPCPTYWWTKARIWPTCSTCSPARSQRPTVFADENQRITDHQSTLDEIRARIRPDSEMRLSRNYRNTREIAVVASGAFSPRYGDRRPAASRIPPRPKACFARPPENGYESVKQITDYATTFRHQQIGVLVPNLNVMTKYLNRLASGLPDRIPLQHYKSDGSMEVDFTAPGVTVINWASAKGLEFDVVFVPELQVVGRDLQDPTFLMLLYVLCSRARDRLFFSYSGEGRPQIVDLFPLDEMEVMV